MISAGARFWREVTAMLSLSIVLPVYNRAHLLVHPLTSLRTAAAATPGLTWEIILVDDGSIEDLPAVASRFGELPIRIHRQENRGLLAARLAGLNLAKNDTVCFLDGDDVVAPGKFAAQLAALELADVAYGDVGRVELPPAGAPLGEIRADASLGECLDPAEFYLGVQPGPHNPIFRRDYLQAAITPPLVPPDRAYDPIAETWFYYHLAIRPARIAYVPGRWTIVGEHPGERISRHWERQAFGALKLMRAFMTACPQTTDTERARRRVGLCAFYTWRALPHGFREFPVDDFLNIWRAAPPVSRAALGGRGFQRLARVVGPVSAGRILRRLKRPAYAKVRSLAPGELAALVGRS